VASSLDEVFELLDKGKFSKEVDSVFVIGGQQVFEDAIKLEGCQRLYITHIVQEFECDTFFPDYKDAFTEDSVCEPVLEDGIKYFFAKYSRP